MNNNQEIQLDSTCLGQRLDQVLVKKLNISRNQIQGMIKNGQIAVNGQAVAPHYSCRTGDKVTINFSAEAKDLEGTQSFALPVVAETDDYLIINKPAGLAVHGASGYRGLTLVDVLLERYPIIKNVGEDATRPGIVHRLDKEVSGLMVIAKSQRAFLDLKNQFVKRLVKKEYAGLVYGQVPKATDAINFPLARSSATGKIAAKPLTFKGEPAESGREAITIFRVAKSFVHYALLEIEIKTGRTHQIRAHLAAYGHPLVGDNLYGTAKTRQKNKELGLNRIILAAVKLSFTDLAGEKAAYEIKLPPEFEELFKKIK